MFRVSIPFPGFAKFQGEAQISINLGLERFPGFAKFQGYYSNNID